MSEASSHVIAAPGRPALSLAFRSALPALLLSSLATLWCRWMVGANLGLFLGTLLLITLCTPPLALSVPIRLAWAPTASILIGASIIWAISASAADIIATEWLRCCLVLASYVVALAGLALLFRFIGLPAPLASALVVVPGLLWLTWPVWLSHGLTEPVAGWLVPAHPGFAINAILKHLGTWDHMPIAYGTLTVLDQDVPYRLPSSIVPTILVHALIGASAVIVVSARHKRIRTVP
ncbi:MAG TPA: hypothetical protein VGI81_06150 [Tepidisphaeraceae bacterium]|jgi:hypothetical protein